MELKDYQIKVLEYLENYLRKLDGQYQDKLDYYEFQKSKGKDANHPEISDYCSETWEEMKASFVVHSPNYTTRRDGLNRNIPNICFKVPTGGGKTLLATCALQRIKQDYFKQNTGFVLWIVPSETIYKQTSKSLRDRQHPYRQMLDRISGGKTIIFEKNDKFNKQDTEGNLCIMLLMLQSGNRDNKSTLRMFRDSGSFSSFYPEIDDYNANKKLLDLNPDLEVADLVEGGGDVISGISIKHSLGNTLKLIRPVVIMDEGHKAASQRALNTLNSFNPSFILELSATPKNNSNVLINVRGSELKQEQMIKLPINVFGSEESGWKQTLNHSHKKLQELSKLASKLQENEGRYIRPIMVIKAEPKKKGDSYDHVEDIKKYLIDNLSVNSEEIRIKLSQKDEIKDEDLLDNLCPVKYIITKDALKEGWDCSFAYILSILSNAKSNTALTQFIGRVLRQPQARTTNIAKLNQCYIYSNNSDVNDTVKSIKKGLEQEGMGDLSDDISTSNNQSNLTETVKLKLNKNLLKKDKIFIPKLNVVEGNKVRNFDYYQDILNEIRWQDYSFDNELILKAKDHAAYNIFKVDVETGEDKQFELKLGSREIKSEKIEDKIDISLMTSQLIDKVPNPWHAARIINKTLEKLKAKFSDAIIAFNSVYIVDEIKKDCFAWVLEKSENIFKDKLESKTIFLKLACEPFSNLNWETQDLINVNIQDNESRIELEKSIFQPQFKSFYNNYEYQVASYINKSEAVKWWHRLGVKGTEYYVQGWKRDKIFPDFLVKLQNDGNGGAKLQFIETKGDHLKGNSDTEYKRKVFDYLNDLAKRDIEAVGELKLVKNQDELNFQMIFEDEWQTQIRKIF